ncbi:hypothetical protein [Spiroplasma endosymbiont of Glossina fuscipes fuscipes]
MLIFWLTGFSVVNSFKSWIMILPTEQVNYQWLNTKQNRFMLF